MSALGGPQALVGWLFAVVIVIADGLVLERAGRGDMPDRRVVSLPAEGFGREQLGASGRLPLHLAVHRISGPLEIASGYIEALQYLQCM